MQFGIHIRRTPEELFERFRRGDSEALGEVFDRCAADLTVGTDGVVHVPPFELEPGGHARGRVVGSDGAQVQACVVKLEPLDGGKGSAAFAPAGVFRLDGLRPGSYRARVHRLLNESDPWSEPLPVTIAAGETAQLRLVLP